MSEKPCVIALMGPTASGKTAMALEIARHFPCEIISVDSALVYRGMDIGTAKPSLEERSRVPHHLIDIIEPSQTYSAMQFCDSAQKLIAEIHARGRLTLLVGGTMLYFKALKDGLDNLPAANITLRQALDEEAAREGLSALYARLARVDAVTAARLKPNDRQRIQRALEIWEITGQPMSSLLARAPKNELPFKPLWLALEPNDRIMLHQRIAKRFDVMLKDDALIKEVTRLRARGDLQPDLPSMRCVGYRQTWHYLEQQIDRTALREQGIAATRQLAKRQLTWLRSMPDRISIDCLDSTASQIVIGHVQLCVAG